MAAKTELEPLPRLLNCRLCSLKFSNAEELDKHAYLCHPQQAASAPNTADVAAAVAASRQLALGIDCTESDIVGFAGGVLTALENSQADTFLTSANPTPASMKLQSSESNQPTMSSGVSVSRYHSHNKAFLTKRRIHARATCPHCKATFSRRASLKTHLIRLRCPAIKLRATATAAAAPAPPASASGLTKSADQQSARMEKVHGPGGGSFACSQCGARFLRKSNCTRHMRMHDYRQLQQLNNKKLLGQSGQASPVVVSSSKSGKKLACSICPQMGNVFDEIGLICHLSNSHGLSGRLHLCSACRQVFTSRSELRQHQSASFHQPWRSRTRHRCPAADCRRCFAQAEQLAQHRLLHATPPRLRPHHCPVCLAAGCSEETATFCWRFQLVEHCLTAQHLSRIQI